MQIAGWKGDVLSHASVLIDDAQYDALRGMVANHDRVGMLPGLAEAIDFARNSFADPLLIITFLDYTDKLVAQHAAVSRYVAFDNLKVLHSTQLEFGDAGASFECADAITGTHSPTVEHMPARSTRTRASPDCGTGIG